MIREMQRQVQLDRQNSKTQNKVLSLLTGHRDSIPSAIESGSTGITDVDDILAGKSSSLTPSVSIAPISKSATKKASEPIDVVSDIASKSDVELPCEIDLDSDEKYNELDVKSDDNDNDLMIVDEDSEEDDDDDVVELQHKRDVVEIDDSSDDDCIM